MSSVYVVDSSFRRTQTKVTPGTYMRDVLEDACRSRKVQPEDYALKTQNNKTVDLSQPFRLSGLSAGAKLQLVQASRSPSVVSVALQLPEELGDGRLNEKFASNTSLWSILRGFEEGVAGGSGNKMNLTQQGIPSSNAGSGRLLYRQPCLNATGRSLESFTDLQKTLAQLGFSNGSVLLRLSYKATDVPLEEAMLQISKYFETEASIPAAAPLTAVAVTSAEETTEAPVRSKDTSSVASRPIPPSSQEDEPPTTTSVPPTHSSLPPASAEQVEKTTPPLNEIAVYLAPSSSTPAAALHEDNDSAFEPNIDDARAFQATLQKAGQNQRLLSDKELEEQAEERQAKLASVRTVDIRVRYPDQSMIEVTVQASETAADLYNRVRGTLRHSTDPFELRYAGARGLQTLANDTKKTLVKDFYFGGKMLVTMVWLPSASDVARTSSSLKDELRSHAQQLKVEFTPQAHEVATQPQGEASKSADTQKSSKTGKGDIEAKMKKFLGFGKK